MNRAERRKAGIKGPKRPQDSSDVSTINAHGICRSCSRRRILWLPARICSRCIESAVTESTEQALLEATRESDAALMAALMAMDEEEGGDSV